MAIDVSVDDQKRESAVLGLLIPPAFAIEAEDPYLFRHARGYAPQPGISTAKRTLGYLIEAFVHLAVVLAKIVVVLVAGIIKARHGIEAIVIWPVRRIPAANPETDLK